MDVAILNGTLITPGGVFPADVGIVVDRSGSINFMLKPLQQGLMAIHPALEELELLHRIVAFEGNVVLQDFDISPVPRALITGLQGATCSRVMPTLEPTFEALMACPEEIKVLLLLHDGLRMPNATPNNRPTQQPLARWTPGGWSGSAGAPPPPRPPWPAASWGRWEGDRSPQERGTEPSSFSLTPSAPRR